MPNTHETLTSLFSDIADAIRAKTGGTADITADTFPTAIGGIRTPFTESIEITQNGTYYPSQGYHGFDEVEVNVSASSLPTGFSMLTPDPLPADTRQITIDFDDISHVLAVAVMCGRDYTDASGNTIVSVAARASTARAWSGVDIYASSNGTSTANANQQPMVEGNSITIGHASYGNFIGGAQYYIFVYKEAAE